jgi:hypothetical protein
VRATKRKAHRGKERAAYDDQYPHAIHAGADDIHDPSKRFHGRSYCRKSRGFSMLFLTTR